MSEENIKNSVNETGCKRYTIPRKQRLLSEDCQQGIPLDCREAKEIINTVHHLTWESNEEFDRNFVISKIYKVENQVLEREFQTKRTELRDEGRSTKELSEHYAFKAEHFGSTVKDQCMKGLYCNGSNSVLGDGKMGVSVWKCPDLCLKSLKWSDSWTMFLIVFRIVKGKVKPVTPKQPNQTTNLEPTPNYDCHVAKNIQYSSTADAATLMIKTQYYLYEYNEEGLARDRPRHCLPFAVIHVNKAAPVPPDIKQLEAIPAHSASEDVPDTSAQEKKVQYLTECDGKMAWRGLIGNRESSLGVVAILAGHKLGLTLWKSFIDVRNKLPLNSLLKVIPGDIRTAWNKPLYYRGHSFSLCMLKPCGPEEKFINFIKSLSMRDHAAGVVTVDSSTVMFLVPSCKLSVELGFCEDEEPWRMFCIVRRRLRRYPSSDPETQSCFNTEANPPSFIEPQALNISLKLEVPNFAKGMHELMVKGPCHRPPGLSLSRSMSVDCANTRSKSTLLRRASDTGCSYRKENNSLLLGNKLQEETNTQICSSDDTRLQKQQHQQPLLSTPPPPPPPSLQPHQTSVVLGPPTLVTLQQQQPTVPLPPSQHQHKHNLLSLTIVSPPISNRALLTTPQKQPHSSSRPPPPSQQQKQRPLPPQVSPTPKPALLPTPKKQPLLPSPQERNPSPSRLQIQPPQVKQPENGKKENQQNLGFNNNFSKVSLFRFDNIPFLEHTGSPSKGNENNSTLSERNIDKEHVGCQVTGGNHSNGNSAHDVIIDRADGICSYVQSNSSQKDSKATNEDFRNYDKYYKHRQTLVPCTKSNKSTSRAQQEETKDNETSLRHQISYSRTNPEPSTSQDMKNDDKSLTLQLQSRELSPKSLGVYVKHKKTLKRKSSLNEESERENIKKRILDFRDGKNNQQDIPDSDSSRGVPDDSIEQVMDCEHSWTSGLQVIELVLIEQEFQQTDERIEFLEKQNAFEILDIDSVTEIMEYEATTTKELPSNDTGVGTTKTDGEFPGKLEKKPISSVISTNVLHECKDGSERCNTSDLPTSVCCTQPTVKLEEKRHTISSQTHTSTISSQDHTSTISSQTHTSTISSQDYTGAISSQDHINNISHFLDEKENKTKTSDAPQIDNKAKGSAKPVSDSHNRSIPYCYSGSSHLMYHSPPLKTPRLVNDNPCINPRYYTHTPPPRNNISPLLPLPNQRFCRLPSLLTNGPWRMPFSRPPLPLFHNSFPYRPPFVPRPNVAHYMCYGDNRNTVL